MSEPSYPKTPRNAINRLRNRGAYDFQTAHGIINTTAVLHVSFAPDPTDPYPIVLPMIGQMGTRTEPHSTDLNHPMDLYLHGSISSRIMKLSHEAIARGDHGLAVCIAATKVDGYVLAHTPFHHSYNFRSAVVHGHATVLITNKIVPERWQNTRTPPNQVELQSTNILRVRVFSGSAKLRWGVPNGDRADLKNQDVLDRYWAGVVPMWETFGEPICAPSNQAPVPDHVRGFVQRQNEENRRVALEASEEQK
ncbi:hypothetical protein BO78DRAFT_442399 [Aspergillus sclerotiicarbonarius CBS 121057]|uniref:Flavin-nucleotide-binding protein n=1 Tax=Aspergillus sclerotiicarbonarius (strain CBS 121057 / IBT 28362) TaxID=1448318 RepID=A0A319EZG0_ASPSB|nr:hypothetical protein BO78DRAFT_442399 [Aspergillus sclerotiicarbonarius CBS 121057]